MRYICADSDGATVIKFRCITILGLIGMMMTVSAVRAVELEDFSDNKKLYIKDVRIIGNKLFSEKEIFEISGFDRKNRVLCRYHLKRDAESHKMRLFQRSQLFN